jgi:hypothetical protein
LCAVRFWNGLVALPAQQLYKHIALDACRAAVSLKWAWAMFKGIHDMGYVIIISATDVIQFDVGRVCQLLDGKANAVWQGLIYSCQHCMSYLMPHQ